MPAQLAVFPKCCLDDLIVHRTLTLFGWIDMAMTLPYVRDRNSIRHFSSRLSHSYLEACRKARRLSRAQLATLLHTSETTIWRIENNQQEPGGALLVALLDAVGADFNELVRLALHPSADQHAQAGTSEEGASSDPRSGVREAPAPYTAALEVSVRQLDTLQLIDLLQLVSDVLRERYGEPARDAST